MYLKRCLVKRLSTNLTNTKILGLLLRYKQKRILSNVHMPQLVTKHQNFKDPIITYASETGDVKDSVAYPDELNVGVKYFYILTNQMP